MTFFILDTNVLMLDLRVRDFKLNLGYRCQFLKSDKVVR